MGRDTIQEMIPMFLHKIHGTPNRKVGTQERRPET